MFIFRQEINVYLLGQARILAFLNFLHFQMCDKDNTDSL